MEETKKYKIIIRAPQQYQYTRERYQQTVVYHPVSLATNVYQEHIHGIYPAVLISPCCACVVDLSPYAVLRTHPLLRQQPGLASQSAGRLEKKKNFVRVADAAVIVTLFRHFFSVRHAFQVPKGSMASRLRWRSARDFTLSVLLCTKTLWDLLRPFLVGKKATKNEKRRLRGL